MSPASALFATLQRLGRRASHALAKPRAKAIAALCLLGAVASAAAILTGFQAATPPPPEMASMLPQGALLTIEAQDFAGLLKHWNDSPEKSAWLKSDNYSVFSRSRLFGRLGDAQGEFAKAAGLPPDMAFLSEVAGTRSIFAWYDIGNLEFLYITRLPAGSAEKTRLMQMRGKFSPRQIATPSGSQTFYVRTGPNSGSGSGPDPNQPPQEDSGGGQSRTVAFATSGDWLLLATHEDLMAGAITLIADQAAGRTANPQAPAPVAQEPWFADAQTAAEKGSDDLRMTLNLEKIVPSPYFRSYWIQNNVTEMKQFRSALADLHLESGAFREERVLLPKSLPSDAEPPSAEHVNLAQLTALLPQPSGVYRAIAAPTVDQALATLDEKLLQRGTGPYRNPALAPQADPAVEDAGAGPSSTPEGTLETRIDLADIAPPTEKGAELVALRQTLASSGLAAMMTVSRTQPAHASSANSIWIPFQSAIVLTSTKDWDGPAMQSAIEAGLAAHLTAGNLGLTWKPIQSKAGNYLEISPIRPLELAIAGRICILTDEPTLMQQMLVRLSSEPAQDSQKAESASLLAGFDLPQERVAFARWTKLLDRKTASPANSENPAPPDSTEPAFFSGNILSLANTFAALQSERLVERKDGPLTRQTVTYAWQH